eukprot:TRINITY_DN4422_c0_g1_i1.p1 TRINITY_DN4422_c0_g1~~TRINITY_DN4422_c0_g1_i1.p1  ORF type:complete len:255 (-),score=41.35 TRINITY_DN4422_c0_g1_i1:123-887(-)
MGLGQSAERADVDHPRNDHVIASPITKLLAAKISQQQSIPRRGNKSPPSSPRVSVSPESQRPRKPALIPTVITWNHGGSDVYVTGSFNNWSTKIPLNKSERDFTTIQYLPPGVHQYKFIVDGRWQHAHDQPIAADVNGNLNNCVEIQSHLDLTGMNGKGTTSPVGTPPGEYGQENIKPDDFVTSEPPALPPHLLRALLNTAPLSGEDPSLLPVPHHVMLNHFYSVKQAEGVRIYGATHRYKSKFVTTVFYKPDE